MPKIRQLHVSTPQGESGDLHRESRYVFNYTATEPAQAIALAMPIRAESYASGGLLPIFEMNRPEGYLLSKIEEALVKTGPLDDLALLHLVGGRQIGRLCYAVPGETIEQPKATISRSAILARQPTTELFNELVADHLGSGISGVQPKVLVPDAEKAIPPSERATRAYSDLIVKASGDGFPYLTQNEYLCMSAARRAGLSVPDFWLSEDGGLFVVARFDITEGTTLGFEDMTVLMNKSSREKYQGSYEGIAKAIQLYCAEADPLPQLQAFFEYLCLIVMTRNGDAHLKNFGLLYSHPADRASVSLAPLYDVVTTSIYAMSETADGFTKCDRTLALNLAKTKQYPSREVLLTFGKSICHVRHPEHAVERIGHALSETLKAERDRMPRELRDKLRPEWESGMRELAG